MRRSTLVVLLSWLMLSSEAAQACSIFTLQRGDTVLLANNEDFTKRGLLWFVPGNKKRLGRVNVGFEKDFAQGSMNEKGLAFDAAALEAVPWAADPKKKDSANLLELIMDTCGTVEEALALFEAYNCPYLAHSQFLFGDATGASAVVTWHPEGRLSVVRGTGERLLCTNNRLETSGYRCKRFVKASQVLDAQAGDPAAAAREALNAIHQRGLGFTSYSTIYNLREQTFEIYNLGNFDEVLHFNLRVALDKGKQVYPLEELFSHSPTMEAVQEGPREYDTAVGVPAEILGRYVGRYEPEGMAGVVIVIEMNEGTLRIGQEAEANRMPLVPESNHTFRFADESGQIRFELDEMDNTIGFTIMRGGDHVARRLPE